MGKKFIALILIILLTAPTTFAQQDFAAIMLNAAGNKILYTQEGEAVRYPASLTKLMTLYLAFSAIQNDKLTWTQKLKISPYASRQVPSKLGLVAGESIPVKTAVLSLIVKSANDSAIVLAEALATSEKEFVKKMNKTASKLGMKKTNFMNANGLHHPNQYTTALDMAILSLALKRDFPNYYKLFASKRFNHKGNEIKAVNEIVLTYPGADGLKTGYTQAAGFNLATSVSKNNNSLVAVIMGTTSTKERTQIMKSLLDMGIEKIEVENNIMLAVLNKPKPHSLEIAMSDKVVLPKNHISNVIKKSPKKGGNKVS